MRILAIETSCDETAVSILECSGQLPEPLFRVTGNALFSQARLHAQYGGVFPSLAKREHSANLVPLMLRALTEADLLKKASTSHSDDTYAALAQLLSREEVLRSGLVEFLRFHDRPSLDAIAVTKGPGLEPALWVGVNFARALSLVWDVPIIPVNHLEGHIVSALTARVPGTTNDFLLEPFTFPVLALLISGGHTELVRMSGWGDYDVIGRTRDDAVGEAFDKVARLLGLPYPGGPEIGRLAHLSRMNTHVVRPGTARVTIQFPRPMLTSKNYDFSFSGLKTAVLYQVKALGELTADVKGAIAREFEDAVTEVLVAKTRRALDEYPARTLVAAGGVAASGHIREGLARMLAEVQPNDTFHLPDMTLTGDNAVMIGMAGYIRHVTETTVQVTDEAPLHAEGGMRLG